MTRIEERNQEVLKLLNDGVAPDDIATRFKLASDEVHRFRRKAKAQKATSERRASLRERIRAADDPEKPWPLIDVIDALGLVTVTRKRLLDHFKNANKDQISLLELMTMCSDGKDGWPDLLKVYGGEQ